MRLQPLFAAVFLAVGFFGSTNALCDLKNGNEVDCNELENVKYIDAYNLTMLRAPVREKTLTSIPFKKFSSSLKRLDLSAGDVQFIESGTFAKFTNLVDLKLSDNSIGQFENGAFEGLKNLKNLDLRRNKIRHLSPAFTKLAALRNLEVSGNPIACDCETLRVRDQLLANGVKISKKVVCVTPSHLKGVSLLEPETEVVCMFEEQDAEMQADQEIGSGIGSDDFVEDDRELTELPPLEDVSIPAVQVFDEVDNDTEIISDDLIIPVIGRSGLVETTAVAVNETEAVTSNISPSNVSNSNAVNDDSEFNNAAYNDDLIIEGSGLIPEEAEGSGWEGSGTDIVWPPVGFRQHARILDEEETTSLSPATTTEQIRTTTPSWMDVIWNTITGESGSSTTSDEKEPETSVTEEQVLPTVTSLWPEPVEPEVTSTPPEESTTQDSAIMNKGFPLGGSSVSPVEEEVLTKKNVVLQEAEVTLTSEPESTTSKPKESLNNFSDMAEPEDTNEVDDMGKASTHQPKRGMGSYVVLAALLGVLAALIGFAAYKSTFCKKKPASDPEQGSELKDVRKALLDSSDVNQVKISSNGNTENAPLVEQKQGSWADPQDVKRWPDSNTPSGENGAKYSPSVAESEPVKPPRKSLPPQEDSNGLQEVKTHAPMSTFAPNNHGASGSSETPPNSPSTPTEESRSPPLSPNTQRVKITLQENPDSIPKTPILITRTKPGVNLVKTP